jgi:hypothetical protein
VESFKASTQYVDWEGTAAADGQPHSLHEYLREKGLMEEHEFLLAATIYFGEHDYDSPFIRAFVFEKGRNFESVKQEIDTIKGAIPVREVKLEMTTKEFLDLFKRFDVVLTWHGLDLTGRRYSASE